MMSAAQNLSPFSRKTAIITGANRGLGFQTTLKLAKHGGWHIIMACRDLNKADAARVNIIKECPSASLEVQLLDLADLQSIYNFSMRISEKYNQLNLLINNAGILDSDPYKLTKDGFKLIMGTNCIGTFALTTQLLPLLEKAEDPRIVTVSSDTHRFFNVTLEDLEKPESFAFKDYAKSKLINLYFAFGLAIRLHDRNSKVISVAAHPGLAKTDLGSVEKRGNQGLFANLMRFSMFAIAQSAEAGALPIFYAATDSAVKNGDYYGPNGFMRLRGIPTLEHADEKAYDHKIANDFYKHCEELIKNRIGSHQLRIASSY